jgi:competence protein ComGC
MDLRINELTSTVQSTGPQADVAKVVREQLQAFLDEKDREKRAETERNLSASIRSPKP